MIPERRKDLVAMAERIHRHISKRSPAQDILNVYNQVDSGKMLSEIHNLILEKYDYSTHEALSGLYSVDELYALSSTENYLREPTEKNRKKRDRHYEEIGYQISLEVNDRQ